MRRVYEARLALGGVGGWFTQYKNNCCFAGIITVVQHTINRDMEQFSVRNESLTKSKFINEVLAHWQVFEGFRDEII